MMVDIAGERQFLHLIATRPCGRLLGKKVLSRETPAKGRPVRANLCDAWWGVNTGDVFFTKNTSKNACYLCSQIFRDFSAIYLAKKGDKMSVVQHNNGTSCPHATSFLQISAVHDDSAGWFLVNPPIIGRKIPNAEPL